MLRRGSYVVSKNCSESDIDMYVCLWECVIQLVRE
jgi:hypothetical protein